MPSRTLGLSCGIAASADDQRRTPQDPAQELTGSRKATGHGDLGPMEHHGVRTVHPMRCMANRKRRIPDHQLGPVDLSQAFDPA